MNKELKPASYQAASLKAALRSAACACCAALVTFVFYQHFDVTFGYWGVVSVAAVMQRTLTLTWIKSKSRLIGTPCGVVLACMTILVVRQWPWSMEILFFLSLFVTGLLIFLKPTWSYLGIVCGITYLFIVCTYHTDPQLWHAVSIYRSVDVLIGVMVTYGCYRLFLFRHATGVLPSEIIPFEWHYKAALLLAGATTLSLLPWIFGHYPGSVWAPIACLFIIEENYDKTLHKAWLRLFAHIVVVVLAAGLSFLCVNTLGIAVSLGLGMFFFGFWLEKPLWGFDSGLANTMAIAYCVILLNEPGQWGVWHSMLARVLNTLLGIGCGMLVVKAIQHYLPRVVKSISLRETTHVSNRIQ